MFEKMLSKFLPPSAAVRKSRPRSAPERPKLSICGPAVAAATPAAMRPAASRPRPTFPTTPMLRIALAACVARPRRPASIVPDESPARTQLVKAPTPSRSAPAAVMTPERIDRIAFTILMTPAAARRPADPNAAICTTPDCTPEGSSPKADTSLSTFWIRPRIGPFAPSPAPMRTFSKSPFSFSRSPFALLSFAAATCAATPDSDTLLM